MEADGAPGDTGTNSRRHGSAVFPSRDAPGAHALAVRNLAVTLRIVKAENIAGQTRNPPLLCFSSCPSVGTRSSSREGMGRWKEWALGVQVALPGCAGSLWDGAQHVRLGGALCSRTAKSWRFLPKRQATVVSRTPSRCRMRGIVSPSGWKLAKSSSVLTDALLTTSTVDSTI